jgi:F-type H+-transporting ATPase subunit gamma
MKTAKLYGAANVEIFSQAEVEASAESGKKVLWIVVSSDKGLCGGIHSSVSKQAKRSLSEASGGSLEGVSSDIPVVVLGDKPKQQLGRALPNNLVLSFNQVGKQVPTFAEACAIADQIDELKVNYDSVKIIYNKVRLHASSVGSLFYANGP